MTNLANQIERLSAAATLEKWLAGTPIYEGDDARSVHYRNNRKALAPPLAALNAQAEVEALRAALEPFAKAADIKLCGEWRDDQQFAQTDVGHHLTFGHLRAARKALGAKP